IVDYMPSGRPLSTPLVPPGAVALFLAPRGAEILNIIRQVSQADATRDAMLTAYLQRQAAARPKLALADVAALLRAQPVVGELRYGGQTMVPYLPVPEYLDVAMLLLPYNRGPLAKGGLTLVEHYDPSSSEQLDAVVVSASPARTKAEEAAAKQSQADSSMQLGDVVMVPSQWPWVAVAVTLVVGIGVIAATTYL